MRWTNLKKKVLAGECVYGTMIRLARDPGALGLYAAAGFDFVFIDMEHGCYNMETTADLIRGAKSVGLPASSGFRDSKLSSSRESSIPARRESWSR